MLSGHVHGGQIRLPLIGSMLVPSRYGRRYDCGVFDEPPTLLHVSRGLGGEHPLRFLLPAGGDAADPAPARRSARRAAGVSRLV